MNGGISTQSRFDWPKQIHFPQQRRQTTTICWSVVTITGASAVHLCVSACACLRAWFVYWGRDTLSLEWERRNHLGAVKTISGKKHLVEECACEGERDKGLFCFTVTRPLQFYQCPRETLLKLSGRQRSWTWGQGLFCFVNVHSLVL